MALDLRDMSVREFHRQMKERSVRGSAYPTIHRYLADKSEPSIAFLKSAGELLQVRETWLAQGDGARTEAEEAMSISPESQLDATIRQTIEALPETKSLPPHLKGVFVYVWGRLGLTRAIHEEKVTLESPLTPIPLDPEMARNLVKDILSPFEAMGYEPDADSVNFQDYVSAMLAALNLATVVPPK